MATKKSLSEEYLEVIEYIAQLEQLLIFFADELEDIPNAGLSEDLLEILQRLKGVMIDGQIRYRAFEYRLKKET